MTTIVDRRPQSQSKSVVNRDRFIKRHRKAIRNSVTKSLNGKSMKDMKGGGAGVSIPSKSLDEPTIRHGKKGIWESVTTGNDQYVKGDKILKPPQDSAGGTGRGDALQDDFLFTLTKEEFADIFFEGLALPNLMEKDNTLDENAYKHAGFSTDGSANNLHLVRSIRNAIGRRIALGAAIRKEISDLSEVFDRLTDKDDPTKDIRSEIALDIQSLHNRLTSIGFLDPIDLRYRSFVKEPKASKRAVMFCIMDVSASMGQEEKEIAKRFFILLYLFLTNSYENVELVFIRHTDEAEEVSEEEFFYGRLSGGTVMYSALELIQKIIETRYPTNRWNIYGVHASDGGVDSGDVRDCCRILNAPLLPLMQHFTYIEVGNVYSDGHGTEALKVLTKYFNNFSLASLRDISDVYPAFRRIFSTKELDK